MFHRRFWPSLTGAVVLLLLASAVQAATSGTCTLATLKGTYGSMEMGTILVDFGFGIPVPFQALVAGVVTYDGAGNLTSSYTANFGGIIVPGAAQGTYTVNPDCTYSDSVPATDSHREGVITGDGMSQEIHVVFTDSWVVGSGTRVKTPQGKCSTATLKGPYGLFGQGTTPTGIPAAHNGLIVFDGKGSFYGTDVSNIGGSLLTSTFTGTYEVSPDCAITTVINTPNIGTLHEVGAITGEGTNQKVRNIMTDSGWVFIDTVQQQ